MATIEDRLMAVESRVGHLETWAGPGQVEALSISLTALRADLATFRRDVRADQARLRQEMTAELGTINTRLGGIEDTMAEMLRRLPPSPDSH